MDPVPRHREIRLSHRLITGHARLKAVLAILKDEPTFAFPDAPGPALVPVRFVEFASEAEANGLVDGRPAAFAGLIHFPHRGSATS